MLYSFFQVEHHKSSGFCYIRVSSDPRYAKDPVYVTSQNCAEDFLKKLEEDIAEINNIVARIEPIKMSADDEIAFLEATHCHICDKRFSKNDQRYKDHDHLSGAYRGPSHNGCNLHHKASKKIKVVLHNCKNYDAHIICSAIPKQDPDKIQCIAQTLEKYITFSLDDIQFIDS